MCEDISTLVYRYSFFRITDNYFRTNWYLNINLTQTLFWNEIKYHMIYKLRYLAVYIASLKSCNVCYIFPYKQQNATYTRYDIMFSFLIVLIDQMFIYGF